MARAWCPPRIQRSLVGFMVLVPLCLSPLSDPMCTHREGYFMDGPLPFNVMIGI